MPLVKFFERLEKIVTDNPDIPEAHLTEHVQPVKGTLLAHLAVLHREASVPIERRTNSVILSSWRTFRDIGEPYGIFKEFDGNKELKLELEEFLRTGHKWDDK